MTFPTGLSALALVLSIAAPQAPPPAPKRPIAAAPRDAAALAEFDAAIARYLAMRDRLLDEKLTGPVPNSSPVELNRASDALAAAIQRARQKAMPGDIFGAAATPVFKQRVVDVVQRENLMPILQAIDDEGPAKTTPTVHLRFPAGVPMATMPAALLAVLPPLPKTLEYRIVGQYLILRDVDAALILDFIPGIVPR